MYFDRLKNFTDFIGKYSVTNGGYITFLKLSYNSLIEILKIDYFDLNSTPCEIIQYVDLDYYYKFFPYHCKYLKLTNFFRSRNIFQMCGYFLWPNWEIAWRWLNIFYYFLTFDDFFKIVCHICKFSTNTYIYSYEEEQEMKALYDDLLEEKKKVFKYLPNK